MVFGLKPKKSVKNNLQEISLNPLTINGFFSILNLEQKER